MKSKIEELLKVLSALDMLVELDVFGNVRLVPDAKKEFERLKAVIHAARETRAAQEAYYKGGRTQTALKVARQWERELDKALDALWSKDAGKKAVQDALL